MKLISLTVWVYVSVEEPSVLIRVDARLEKRLVEFCIVPQGAGTLLPDKPTLPPLLSKSNILKDMSAFYFRVMSLEFCSI